MIHAVVDTNILVRSIIKPYGSVGPILRELQQGSYRYLYTPALLGELVDVLSRPRLSRKYGITLEDVRTVTRVLLRQGREVHPLHEVVACRDPDDDKFLTAAVAGGADLIVSGDQDLLTLHPFEGIPIVEPAGFLRRLAVG